MEDKVTIAMERYLRGICELEEKHAVARTSELVKLFGVAPGTVTNTVKRLREMGLVTHRRYRGVKLTGKGRRIALRAIMRYRLLERFLTDILYVERSKVPEAAYRLEQCVTNDILEKIEEALDHGRSIDKIETRPT